MASVGELISSAQSNAQAFISQANSATSSAVNAMQSIGFTIVSPGKVQYKGIDIDESAITPPTLTDVVFDKPIEPERETRYITLDEIDAGTAPELKAKKDALTLPDKPMSLEAIMPEEAKIDLNMAWPDVPAYMNSVFEAPTPTMPDVPDAPSVTIPDFTATAPTSVPSAPTDLATSARWNFDDISGNMYANITERVDNSISELNPEYKAQMARIEEQLAKYLEGGTALKPAVEDAIYERAKTKNLAEARRLRDQALTDAADRGFTLPNGALMSAIQQARQGGSDNLSQSAREIAIAQAEMEQKNLQFAVTTSTDLRKAVISATLQQWQNMVQLNAVAIDYAKTITQFVVETYNIQVRVFESQLDAYKAEASVYEARVRGALALVEVFKAQLEGVRAQTDIEKTKVDVFRSQIESLRAYADAYKSQVEVVVSKANLERLKVDIFQAQVQGYTAQVQAKESEWRGYVAAVQGETAKMSAYQAEVQAYQAEVGGYAAKMAALATKVDAQAKYNDGLSRAYAARVAAFGEEIKAEGERVRTTLDLQGKQINAYSAEVQAKIGYAQIKLENAKANHMAMIKQAELDLNSLLRSAELTQRYGSSLASIANGNAGVYAQLASSAMSGINALAAQQLTE